MLTLVILGGIIDSLFYMIEVISMSGAKEFIEKFMYKLNNDEFVKDNQPNTGSDLSDDFVASQIQSYSKLLDSGIIQEAVQ